MSHADQRRHRTFFVPGPRLLELVPGRRWLEQFARWRVAKTERIGYTGLAWAIAWRINGASARGPLHGPSG